MPTTTKQTAIALWRYQCPACGIGDADVGQLAPDHALYCEICLEEDRRHVRLRRWPAEYASGPLPSGGLGRG